MRAERGFTLLEIIVAAIIVLVLASVATPLFFRAIRRARASEAEAVVGNLLTAEMGYYQANDTFTSDPTQEFIDRYQSDNFNYTVLSSDIQQATVQGSGSVPRTDRIVVTGTVRNSGRRTLFVDLNGTPAGAGGGGCK